MEQQGNYLIKIMILIVIIFAVGTTGYYLIEDDWTLLDGFYMTAISITTVGYGEIKPLSDAGKIFTVILIFLGLGSVAVFASQLAKTFIENNLNRYFGANKMMKKIGRLKNHYIICGFGGIGSSISAKLDDSDIPFVIVEENEETANWAQKRNYHTILGKATYDSTLIQAGIKRATGLVVSMGDDSLNMYVSLAARELNPDLYIIARGYKPDIENRLIRAGANTVVYPIKMGGEMIAREIKNQYKKNGSGSEEPRHSSVMGYSLKIYNHFSDNPAAIGEIREKTGAENIVTLKRENNEEVSFPKDSEILKKNDTLLMLVNNKTITKKIPGDENDKTLFEWSDNYNTGIRTIDEEHQKLFEVTDQFLKALKSGLSREYTSRIFDRLIEDTIRHFENEEKLFSKHGYPEKDEHISEHRKLTEKIIELNRNRDYVFSDNVEDFLFSWLRNHIIKDDIKFAEFMWLKK